MWRVPWPSVIRKSTGRTGWAAQAYYIQKALGSRAFGVVFAVLLIACFAYGFNALQAYNAGSALQYYLPGYASSVWPAVVGAVLAALTGLCIFGGVRRISAITSGIVPVMAAIYIALGLFNHHPEHRPGAPYALPYFLPGL